VEFEHWQDMAPPLMPTGKLEEQLKEYRALKLKVFDSNNNVLRNPLVLDELDQAIENASAVTYEEIPKDYPAIILHIKEFYQLIIITVKMMYFKVIFKNQDFLLLLI